MLEELMEFRPVSQVWATYFHQCAELGRAELVSGRFDPYVDNLVGEFESYFDEYDKAARASSSVAKNISQIEAEFQDVYTRYSTAHASEYDSYERKMAALEANYEKLLKEEEGLEQSMADLEDMIYNCLYLFEDIIAVCDDYGSDKAERLQGLLEAVYGE